MRVKFLMPKGFHKVGSICDLSNEEAERLMQRGYVERITEKKAEKSSSEDKSNLKSKSKKFLGGDK